ncbi:MAG: sensor histidine kinase [Oscillatoriophycideae cyanobacterium NC_groundwater_1537_Pr4_S-0.65um_50_18]|nr:sensor histidine kinase [Oscillatoriophycideae cyanobacterium NC_groundwater_1537_Pr4_S-0.65um_50_18]
MTFTQPAEFTLPSVSEANRQGLSLESTLADLPLHQFQVSAEVSGQALAHMFDRHPIVPGVLLQEGDRFLGMISRQRLLEFLIRPQGMAFLSQPLSVLYRYTRGDRLRIPATTPIVVAAKMALQRSPLERAEPIIVQFDAHNAPNSHADAPTHQMLDVHELNMAYWQIRGLEDQVRHERAQIQMIQIEKMASLGRLVDGVAHEILDPVGFIWGNLVHVSSYTQQILRLLEAYEQYVLETAGAKFPGAIAQLQADIELDYLRQDLPQTITSMKSGADRLKKLAASLQNFCHVDEVYPKPANLHECLDSILLLLKSRLSGEIEIVRDYGHLPPISCYAGQLSQVFISILTNAVEALLDRSVCQGLAELGQQSGEMLQAKPQITVKTQVLPACEGANSGQEHWVSIQIADNGSDLSAAKKRQIEEALSAENRASKETSLGLSYQIVTAKHGGKLIFRSLNLETTGSAQENMGTHRTEFEILLPIA